MILPKYPIYVPSKGRYETGLTPKFLIRDKVPFNLVVEPQEAEEYRSRYPEANLLILPWSNLGTGGLIAVRNWCKEHSTKNGHKRHWQLDDNIRSVMRKWEGKRLPCESGPAFAAVEDFVDRYENVAIAGMNYSFFAVGTKKPYVLNAHVYSCTLVLNEIPNRWRLAYNDDTDMCLQVLADGWCTVQTNIFLIEKMQTMKVKGGNTPIYQADGRLRMARMLERQWPHVVETNRRFGRPQHIVKYAWRRFDTQLKLKAGIDLKKLPANEYGLKLTAVSKIKSEHIKALVKKHAKIKM
jgi:hypothetical protein